MEWPFFFPRMNTESEVLRQLRFVVDTSEGFRVVMSFTIISPNLLCTF